MSNRQRGNHNGMVSYQQKTGNWPLATGTNACSGLLDLVSLETFLKCCWRHENYHDPQDIKATEQTFLARCNLLSPLGRWNVCDKCNWPICKGVSSNGGSAQYRWMVYFMENPLNKWMMTGGTPISSETSTMVGICLEPNRTEKVPKPCLEPS
jgi:hypothetical protein